MHAATDRLEFAPPPQPAAVRAFGLAIVAHILLMIALTWGINWNRETENVVAEAELWSSVPQQAAPKAVEAPQVAPPPTPEVKAPPPVVAPAPRQPDIALEQEKKKKLEARKKAEEQKREQLAEKKAADERKKQDDLAKALKEKARLQLDAKLDAKKLEAQRQENLRRMQGMAGATGAPDAAGAAQRSAGPSDSYGGRIRARVKPNIVFTDDVSGNPTAEVEVRMAPDGTITSRKLVKSSGAKSWDDAVLRALDKTEILPRDVDGRVHSPLIIEFKPKG